MPYATLVDEPVSLDQRLDHGSDQRQAERRQISHPAIVSIAGTPNLVLHAMIRNVSAGGTQIRLDQALPSSTLVKIEYNDNLLLGEVIYCQPEQSGWLVGVKIEHGLFELAALATAMQAF
jgi:hypothetical protein